ncbi:MAG: HAD-IIIC family phosphatase [Lachnospiraceae bacterium]|nr:HAD-IIIC family phosphatase [Lachnospiraceae bacterium]
MKELEYPFDGKRIIGKKLKLRRYLLKDGTKRIKKKIVILGGSTTNDIKLCIELFLLNQGIEPEFYESDYNQYYQEAMFPSEEFVNFAPDIIYIYTSNRNINSYPNMSDTAEAVDHLIKTEIQKYSSMWDNLNAIFHCPIIQNNFEKPVYRLMGNQDVANIHGKVNFINRLNQKFVEYAQIHENFYICDLDYISSDYGLSAWHDLNYWYMYKYAMSLQAIPYLSFNVANIIKSIFGKNKKGFVLDLDNTLWGGVVGDDGADNIEIGPEEAVGQAYLEFQQYLKEHKQLGVILNVDSKNEAENAIAGLNHPDGVLKPDDMIVIKANWEPKDRNFQTIANELTLLPESLVFVDDNPAERHIVSEQFFGVAVPDIGSVQDYIKVLDRSGFFETTVISSEDAKRNDMYRQNAEREQQKAKFKNYTDYLLSLNMKGTIKPFEPVLMGRISQLSNKSNQFNLTTRRYTQEEIETVAADNAYIDLYGRLEDQFGDNGVVSVVIGHQNGRVVNIDLWIMSCRVLKRDMEYAMMDEFVRTCKLRQVDKIIGHYYPTSKNAMVKDFFGLHGFRKISEDNEGNTVWELNVIDYRFQNHVIVVNEELMDD